MQRPARACLVGGSVRGDARDPLGRGALLLRWEVDPARAGPFACLKASISEIRRSLGEGAIAAAIGPHRGVLSPVLHEYASELSPGEERARDETSGLAQARWANPVIRQRPLLHAWGATFAALAFMRRLVIWGPAVGRVDIQSLATVRWILKHAANHVTVILGDERLEPSPTGVMDAIVQKVQARHLRQLRAIRGSVWFAPGHALLSSETVVRPHDKADLVSRALAHLDENPAVREGSFAAMRAAFDAMGFNVVLRLAQAALASLPAGSERREAHRLAGLSWHNLEPIPDRTSPAAAGQLDHFPAALAGETDALTRAHLLYRLCMVRARSFGDLKAARRDADEAVEAAGTSALPEAALFEAWARNGRAYVQLRASQAAAAASDCEAALARLADTSVERAAPAIEVQLVRAFLSNNLARIAARQGDWTTCACWCERTSIYSAAVPVHESPSTTWLAIPEDPLHPAASQGRHERELAMAREQRDCDSEASASHALGLIHFRLGDGPAAYAHFKNALRIWRILGYAAEELVAVQLNCAVAAFRSGSLARADARLRRLSLDPLCRHPVAQAELQGARAMVAAAAGDAARAIEQAEMAIRLAEQAGDAETLARVLRSAAEAALSLGLRSEARQWLERAEAALPDAPPEDILGIVLAQWAAGADADSLLPRALAVVEPALLDVNAWWDLPRLLDAIMEALRKGKPFDASALSLVLDVAEERADTRPTAQWIREHARIADGVVILRG